MTAIEMVKICLQVVFWKIFFAKVNLEKVSRRQQKHKKLPSMQRLKTADCSD